MVRNIFLLILLLNLSLVYCSSVRFVNYFSELNDSNKNVIESSEVIKSENDEYEITEVDLIDDDDVSADDESNSAGVSDKITAMNSALHKIGRKYYCSVEVTHKSFLLMYGTKTWTFPKQNVNLTLTYPSENDESDFDKYFITAFELIVYIDGGKTKAYLNSGPHMRDTLSLFIVSEDISYLSFQFSVHGTTKATFRKDKQENRKGRFRYQCA